jgi:excinuclease UvrABC nuclease subunit
MSFQIQVDGRTYYFQGPVTPQSLPEKSGVYMVMGDGGHPVYIGEAKDIRQRVTRDHEKERCWKRHGSGESIRYVLIPNAHVRVKVEVRAIEKWQPVCN